MDKWLLWRNEKGGFELAFEDTWCAGSIIRDPTIAPTFNGVELTQEELVQLAKEKYGDHSTGALGASPQADDD